MNVFTRSEFLFHVLLAGFGYIILSQIIPAAWLVVLLNSIFVGVSVSVLFVLSPLAIRAVKTRTFDKVSQLSTGIIVTWVSLLVMRGISVIIHAQNKTAPLVNSPAVSIATYLAIIGGLLYITAPGMPQERLQGNGKSLAFSFIISIILATATYLFQMQT